MEDPVAARLRAAGCVYAEEEAAILREAAGDDADRLAEWVARRCAGEPLEQVVGWVELGGLRLRVAPGCFVPRQRTMLLVAAVVEAVVAEARPGAVVVEAYAGVAPVATHVARAVPDAKVHAAEVDERAAAAARRNLGAAGTVHPGDGLGALPADLRGRVDVLAAVPPYVPDGALDLMPLEARDHEPATALLGGPDGLDHVRALLEEARGWLTPGGVVLLEMGADQVGRAVADAERRGYAASYDAGEDGRTAVLRARQASMLLMSP